METSHVVHIGDARSMSALEADSVELVVTSPPYPMIEMWDETFARLDPVIGERLDEEAGEQAFELMHETLDPVWAEVDRVLVDGGVACVNIGDATRSVGERFRLYPNHVRVTEALTDRGFDVLPPILWRKPTNRVTKFMGSGMLPPNAYVTLEHEFILILRNGGQRRFDRAADRRYESAYFWEERNDWFSDLWELTGETQSFDGDRERSGAFPLEIPFRLINMFSVYGDTVLDPFWGTGTTTLAAMATARSSIGYELAEDVVETFDARIDGVVDEVHDRNRERLMQHREAMADRSESGDPPAYTARHYDFPVITKQERDIRLYDIESVRETSNGRFSVVHTPV